MSRETRQTRRATVTDTKAVSTRSTRLKENESNKQTDKKNLESKKNMASKKKIHDDPESSSEQTDVRKKVVTRTKTDMNGESSSHAKKSMKAARSIVTRSKTPTIDDSSEASTSQEPASLKTQKRSLRSKKSMKPIRSIATRSKTPTIDEGSEASTSQEATSSKVQKKSLRSMKSVKPVRSIATRSKTPTIDESSEASTSQGPPSQKVQKRSLRSKKSMKPARSIATRSKTPTIDEDSETSTSQEATSPKVQKKSLRSIKSVKPVRSIATRSKTPTIDESSEASTSQGPTSPKVQKRSLRSKKSTLESPENTSIKRRPSLTIGKPGPDRKFFKNLKSKRSNVQSKISPLKRAVLGLPKEKKAVKTKNSRVVPVARESSSFRLRQPTLEESISKIPKKSLRPKNAKINYCDESTLMGRQNSSNKPTDNEHEENADGQKRPIYKRINLNASQEKDKDKVYDFVPDKNDVKRKKKRAVRKAPAKKAKIADTNTKEVKKRGKKTNLVSVKVTDNIETANKVIGRSAADQKTAAATKPVAQTVTKNNEKAADVGKRMDVSQQIHDQSTLVMEDEPLSIALEETLQLPPTSGVRIVSDLELRGEKIINITKTPLQPKANQEQFSRPFRATNAFNSKPSMQVKTMMDNSLFRRSLSPISKAATPAFIEDGSPWRPLPIPTFSKVKNVVQSTPMGEKYNQMQSKTALMPKRQPRTVRLHNIVDKNDENANVPKKNEIASVENMKSPVKKIVSPKKNSTNNSKSPRKFGTEISNLNSPVKKRSPMSPPKLSPVDTWNLKQANLNNFLNLPEKPESTRITTARGIFDDAHSTPITVRKVPKTTELNAENAFGFDEFEDDTPQIDISSIKSTSIRQDVPVKKIIQNLQKKIFNKRQENEEPHPARFSIGEIKKTLQNKEVELKKDNNEGKTTQAQVPFSPKKAVVQAITFRDTFDIENQGANANENIEESIKSVPLFLDLEPAHFTEPPRYSYKRKRHDKYDTSYETEDDEHNENNEGGKQKHQPKKKRIGKVAKEQQKQLNEWAKNINKTFDEIEHFDLVVE